MFSAFSRPAAFGYHVDTFISPAVAQQRMTKGIQDHESYQFRLQTNFGQLDKIISAVVQWLVLDLLWYFFF